MSAYQITVLPGDGIGPEVTQACLRVLHGLSEQGKYTLECTEQAVGGAAIDAFGDPFPDAVAQQCIQSDAVLLGAVGGPKWDHHTGAMRPESGLLKLRKKLGAFANLRPVSIPPSLAEASPLRPEVAGGTDMLVVRELTGGIYFGEPRDRISDNGGEVAFNTMRYSTEEIERVARVAFEWAGKRSGRVTSVDKANVLVVSQLWRDVVSEVHRREYASMELSHMYVDNAAMQLVLNPKQFDVLVTGNLFGDILSDAAATLGGSLGLLPSASVGGPVGIFEPVHGSAPDIAGQGLANPIAMILSGAMMLDELHETATASAIRSGVEAALETGARTADLKREGTRTVGTEEMTDLILEGARQALST